MMPVNQTPFLRACRAFSVRRVVPALLFAGFYLAAAGLACAQNSNPGGYPFPRPGWGNGPTVAVPGDGSGDPAERIAREKRLGVINVERQKALVADTQKLVKLAAELNAEINSAHQTELTAGQLRKVAEIEKLAHSVRDKMSSAFTGVLPNFGTPSAIPLPMQ
jgi:hypothetical protein